MIYKNGFILLRLFCGFFAFFTIFASAISNNVCFHNESNYNVVSAFNAH